jgi:hypothetical protein
MWQNAYGDHAVICEHRASCFLVQDLARPLLNVFKGLKQIGNTARIIDVHLKRVDNKIKESPQLSISESPGSSG